MKKIIVACFIASSIFLSYPSKTHSDTPPEAQIAPKTTAMLISEYADQYDVSAKTMHKIIKCESGYNAKAVGDSGKSLGLVQIHMPSHKNVTRAEAFDREFAIEFLAKGLAKKQGRQWTCYRV